MKIINVNASRSYEILIGNGLLKDLGIYISKVISAEKLCIVSDHTVWDLYGDDVKDTLEASGFSCSCFVYPAGENSKNGSVYLELLNFLAENTFTRTDCLVALGGGVVGDLTGFAAATYLRGIPFIQVPTTVLAAVDSSVGGKTAIDLPSGKNLAGAFYQPSLVVCDLNTFDTLPGDIFRDGCAEIIKYGVLYDCDLCEHLRVKGLQFDREAVVARCIELKRDVVNRDEFDRGERQMLNLGHTVGHGVEACSGFETSHGKAVAIGMAIIGRAAAQRQICSRECSDRIVELLNIFGLPTETAYSSAELYRYALSDKKRSGGSVNLIVPEKIGLCRILPTLVEDLQAFIETGL